MNYILKFEILLLIFVISFLSVLFIYLQHSKAHDGLKRRIKVLKGESLLVDSSASLRQEVWFRRFLLSGVKDSLQKMSAKTARKYRMKFDQAGWNSQDAPLIGSTVNVGMILIGFVIFFVLINFIETLANAQFMIQLIILMKISIVSLRFFEYVMDFIIKRQREKIRAGLSYAIDLIGICVRSGYGLEKSFEKIAEEMAKYNPEICQEFGKTAIELSILPERNVALRNLARRIDLPIVQVLVSGLIQADEQGASLANTLRVMSIEFSKQKILEIEAKATKLPALLTLPLILFLLPAMMIVLLGPAVSNISKLSMFSS